MPRDNYKAMTDLSIADMERIVDRFHASVTAGGSEWQSLEDIEMIVDLARAEIGRRKAEAPDQSRQERIAEARDDRRGLELVAALRDANAAIVNLRLSAADEIERLSRLRNEQPKLGGQYSCMCGPGDTPCPGPDGKPLCADQSPAPSPAQDVREAWVNVLRVWEACPPLPEELEQALSALEDAFPAIAQSDAQPVGWIWRDAWDSCDEWQFTTKKGNTEKLGRTDQVEIHPVYTAPPSPDAPRSDAQPVADQIAAIEAIAAQRKESAAPYTAELRAAPPSSDASAGLVDLLEECRFRTAHDPGFTKRLVDAISALSSRAADRTAPPKRVWLTRDQINRIASGDYDWIELTPEQLR